MKLYRTKYGIFVEMLGSYFSVEAESWDELVCSSDLQGRLQVAMQEEAANPFDFSAILAPVVGQEVWAAGVTYFRSRSARIEESKDTGGGTFYDRVYAAARPELFFKAVGHRVIGPGGEVRIRADAKWSVPEPELTVLFSPSGAIVGYTIGNDMSSRDIEGENPLYLPQAKMYDGSCALGPCILLANTPLVKTTAIRIEITRGGSLVFDGETTLAELKREVEELSGYLFREYSFPEGVLLMTGTGIVPGDAFTLAQGDVIGIEIEGIGRLDNVVG